MENKNIEQLIGELIKLSKTQGIPIFFMAEEDDGNSIVAINANGESLFKLFIHFLSIKRPDVPRNPVLMAVVCKYLEDNDFRQEFNHILRYISDVKSNYDKQSGNRSIDIDMDNLNNLFMDLSKN